MVLIDVGFELRAELLVEATPYAEARGVILETVSVEFAAPLATRVPRVQLTMKASLNSLPFSSWTRTSETLPGIRRNSLIGEVST